MSDIDYPERRRHARVKLSLYIDWGFDEDCTRTARITSLSVGGCFVQTDEEATSGQPLFVCIELPEKRLLRGEVRYHMPGVGFGVMFRDLTIEDQLKLEDLVEHYKRQ